MISRWRGRRKCIVYTIWFSQIVFTIAVKNWYVIKGRRTPVYVQKEVQAYGPVVAYFDLYDDFFLYKSG